MKKLLKNVLSKFKTSTPALTPTSNSIEKNEAIQKPVTKTKKYKITGMEHYRDNIMTLAIENDDYKLSKKELIEECLENERIYERDFYFTKVELVPEPNNPYDPKAIKVLLDGLHVGYIKSGSCSHIHNLINDNRIEKIDCKIAGGKSKYLHYDENEDKYELSKEEIPLFIHLLITEK